MKRWLVLLVGCSLLAGCATGTIESRRKDRAAAYAALTAEEKELVDKGQIKVGMNQDAVYIAWGPPAEILQSETQDGLLTTWLYHGVWTEETRYWTFREVPYKGTVFLERYLEHDYFPRNYVQAEIVFAGGEVTRWRTLPRPTY